MSGIALLGTWPKPAARVAERIRQIGIGRIVWGADGAVGGMTPEAANELLAFLADLVADEPGENTPAS